MNSIIEAQQEFTNCFGELTIKHLCGVLVLPVFSTEHIFLDKFIDEHQEPAPVVIRLSTYRNLSGEVVYRNNDYRAVAGWGKGKIKFYNLCT